MVINISFVSKGGRGLRCVVITCDKLDRNILFSVFCPSEYLENTCMHAFFMMKKRLWTASGTRRVQKNFRHKCL
ncbi:unnamed protein product [Staurois parvus]|uniref:Uncharacterized protein n=1 Tax=Staurois parvus TaxID=386267 RepID=A0ABN9CDN1_9NEOB|nr:unnamed protein product [Staurois parvus]